MAGRPKGLPKTGGRAKGTPNKRTLARQSKMALSGLTPLEFMLRVLRNPKATMEERMWAADKAAPYMHPKLASVEHSGPAGNPIKVQVESARDTLHSKIARLASIGGS